MESKTEHTVIVTKENAFGGFIYLEGTVEGYEKEISLTSNGTTREEAEANMQSVAETAFASLVEVEAKPKKKETVYLSQPQSLEEFEMRLAKVPTFSRQVYDAIKEGLYAEPGFSDVDANDIAETLGCTAEKVGGALSYLCSHGLVWIDYSDVNGTDYNLLHTYEHDTDGFTEKSVMEW